MIKKLILINGIGKEYDLLSVAKSPTFQIEGFGYTDGTEFLRIGNRFFPLDEMPEQREISLTLLFWHDANEMYNTFVSIAKHNPLTIVYANDAKEYNIPCKLREIGRVEKVGFDIFGCSVVFALTGNAYELLTAECKADALASGKTYPYTYDYQYSNDGANRITIRSESYINSTCILTIYGGVESPIWRHYLNGELVETGAYSGTIPVGNRLVIDSRAIPQSIIEYDSTGAIVADRYQLCDFSTQRFLHVGEGDNRYVFSHEGITDIAAKVEAYIEYEAI